MPTHPSESTTSDGLTSLTLGLCSSVPTSNPQTPVLLSWGCCHKVPQTWWLPTQMYSLTVRRGQRWKPVHWAQGKGLAGGRGENIRFLPFRVSSGPGFWADGPSCTSKALPNPVAFSPLQSGVPPPPS